MFSVVRVINKGFVAALCLITQCVQISKAHGFLRKINIFAIPDNAFQCVCGIIQN